MRAAMEHVLKRRATPCLAVLGRDYRVLDADAGISALCGCAASAQEHPDRLPDALERMLRAQLYAAHQAYVVWNAAVLVRASRLNGPADSECIVVSMQAMRTRAPLDEASRRFSLSRREAQVLECILCGLNASEIASRLHISKRTVGEYFKHLTAKIGARNRSELVARVFGWDGPLYE